jgi:hypothetical protein
MKTWVRWTLNINIIATLVIGWFWPHPWWLCFLPCCAVVAIFFFTFVWYAIDEITTSSRIARKVSK